MHPKQKSGRLSTLCASKVSPHLSRQGPSWPDSLPQPHPCFRGDPFTPASANPVTLPFRVPAGRRGHEEGVCAALIKHFFRSVFRVGIDRLRSAGVFGERTGRKEDKGPLREESLLVLLKIKVKFT